MKPALSIFFPAYNDALSIPGLVDRVAQVATELGVSFEVIIVNDGSPDNIVEVVSAMMVTRPFLRLVNHEVNKGYGSALRTGFSESRGDLIFYTDGDAQYDITDLKDLFGKMSPTIDVVNGYKKSRADGIGRAVIGNAYNSLARIFFRIPIRDVDCDFRLIRAEAIKRVHLRASSGVICTEMIYKLARSGARFDEFAVTHLPREFGASQFFTVRRVGKTLIDFFVLWFQLVVLRESIYAEK